MRLEFPSFLLAISFHNAFIVRLVKMWPGGTPRVVVRTLKIKLSFFSCKGV